MPTKEWLAEENLRLKRAVVELVGTGDLSEEVLDADEVDAEEEEDADNSQEG